MFGKSDEEKRPCWVATPLKTSVVYQHEHPAALIATKLPLPISDVLFLDLDFEVAIG